MLLMSLLIPIMSLKRHPALQPFSREHVIGLYHAHQLMWLSNSRARCDMATTITNFSRAWKDNLSEHFASEEIILGPLPIKSQSITQLMSEHRELRQMFRDLFSQKDPSVELCLQAGRALEQHIRWEEHHLFPEIELALGEEDLRTLAARTEAMEVARKHCST
jgi:hemerythrin-like domain-containing protein